MNTQRLACFALGALLASAGACDLDVPDLNNPSLTDLQDHPTAVQVEGACTGLLIGNRAGIAAENGYILQLGVLGREAYNFDTADPRYIAELLAGALNGGSPFGGNFWANPYANIRLANVILHALDKLSSAELSDDNKAVIRGFVNTIQALDLLIVINTHDTNGAVIDADVAIVLPPAMQPLGAIVDKATTFARINTLLDGAATDLASVAATFSFPFELSPGYAGFDTPATFRQFNRALRARTAAYTKDYPTVLTALGESFIDDDPAATPDVPLSFDLGVYHVYSTKTGDVANALINPNIYVHPSVEADAQKNGTAVDARYTAKVRPIDPDTEDPGSVTDTPLMSSLKFKAYSAPESPVPIIRNEELILLKAEALFFTGNVGGAVAELNVVRTGSGKLAPLTGTPTEVTFVDELLYERRYSLLFEGHRWIDLRRFGRTEELVLDDPTYARNIRYPIPLQECTGRPNEPRCSLGSL
jgi:starch-binding outer membrane protein, SusD/RagB family